MLCCGKGEFAESPLEEPCARAVSPSLESFSWDCSSLQCKGVQEHERRGGSALNLHLCLFSHPVPQESRHCSESQGTPFYLSLSLFLFSLSISQLHTH